MINIFLFNFYKINKIKLSLDIIILFRSMKEKWIEIVNKLH